MAARTLYQLLGLDVRADTQNIKLAYRRLAKLYHPDKNTSPEATALFQELNQAYHTLTNDQLRAEYDLSIGISEPLSDTCHKDVFKKSLPNVAISIRENMMSVTIDVTDIMFLAFVEQCEHYYKLQPIDRGHHGLQFKFDYCSPQETESYGSISLTFYPSTARLHVQGSSYLLWVEEHLPSIYADTETQLMTHTSKWAFLTRQKGIGRKREPRPLCITTRADLAVNTNRLAVCKSAASPISTAVVCTPAVSPVSCTHTPAVSNGLIAASHTPSVSSSTPAALQTLTMSVSTTAVTHRSVVSSDSAVFEDASSESDSPSEAVHPSAQPQPLADVTTDVPSNASTVSLPTPPAGSHSETVVMQASPEALPQAAGPATRQALKGGTAVVSSAKPPKDKKDVHPKKPSIRKGKQNKSASCSVNVEPCQPGCNVTSKQAADMIRCSLCMAWHHNVCVGEDRRYVGVWTCLSCRQLPALVLSLQTQVTDLAESLDIYRENDSTQKDVINRLKSENNRLSQKVSNLEKNNMDLSKLIQTMSDVSPSSSAVQLSCDPPPRVSVSVPTNNRFAALSQLPENSAPSDMQRQGKRVRFADIPRPTTTPVSVSVIGSSIVRGVAPLLNKSKEYSVDGFVYPGRTAKQINGCLRHIPTSDISVVSAGSNDIENHSVPDCVNEVKKVIDNISRKRRGKTVIMCQIPHRYDKPLLNSKIDEVNIRIADEIKRYSNVHILTHTVVKADFKKDLLHFNERGVAKFALQIRHVIRKLRSSK